ncbi:hypothetical protein QBC41DRAFT_315048 [Cercophora samala]|uniref:Uncharacterized protein n=1 Tax=Cercophora samala TaxID=330535 RepID=A0AA39ZIT1_9PEZI|nr:hypothetical protein QBC41DRAFT_315048 [Cercophora samala]
MTNAASFGRHLMGFRYIQQVVSASHNSFESPVTTIPSRRTKLSFFLITVSQVPPALSESRRLGKPHATTHHQSIGLGNRSVVGQPNLCAPSQPEISCFLISRTRNPSTPTQPVPLPHFSPSTHHRQKTSSQHHIQHHQLCSWNIPYQTTLPYLFPPLMPNPATILHALPFRGACNTHNSHHSRDKTSHSGIPNGSSRLISIGTHAD